MVKKEHYLMPNSKQRKVKGRKGEREREGDRWRREREEAREKEREIV